VAGECENPYPGGPYATLPRPPRPTRHRWRTRRHPRRGVGNPAAATPPGIPSKATAQTRLDALTVAAQGSTAGYSRDLFPRWSTVSGSCNTRETVLKRDGTAVVVTNSSCAATSGSWYCPYDGATWTAAADVDIDHVIPLAEAWRSGANTWTTTKRQSFANDLTRPQLIAVTDNVNQSKATRTLPPGSRH
jgi:hypothetical protein